MRLYADRWPKDKEHCPFHCESRPYESYVFVDIAINPKPIYCKLTCEECDLKGNSCSGLYHHIS